MDLQREGQSFGTEPQPDATHGPKFREAIEDGADGRRDGLVGMKADLTVLVAPHESDGQAAAQFATRRLVADAAVQPRAQRMKLGLRHGSLQSENQPIIKKRGVINAVPIADQGVGYAAQIQEPIPIRVAPRETGHFESEDDADVSQRDLRGEMRKAGSLGQTHDRARESEVFIDDLHLLRRPPEFARTLAQRVLTRGRFSMMLTLRFEPVAEALGNTAAISRKSYVHPALIEAAKDAGAIGDRRLPRASKYLSSAERGLTEFLEALPEEQARVDEKGKVPAKAA